MNCSLELLSACTARLEDFFVSAKKCWQELNSDTLGLGNKVLLQWFAKQNRKEGWATWSLMLLPAIKLSSLAWKLSDGSQSIASETPAQQTKIDSTEKRFSATSSSSDFWTRPSWLGRALMWSCGAIFFPIKLKVFLICTDLHVPYKQARDQMHNPVRA